jgi:hypothetical protein
MEGPTSSYVRFNVRFTTPPYYPVEIDIPEKGAYITDFRKKTQQGILQFCHKSFTITSLEGYWPAFLISDFLVDLEKIGKLSIKVFIIKGERVEAKYIPISFPSVIKGGEGYNLLLNCNKVPPSADLVLDSQTLEDLLDSALETLVGEGL